MDYTIHEVLKLSRVAAKAISDSQPEVWRMSEWTICHHLAGELGKVFGGFHQDVELVKLDGRRPDIVIHQRGHNRDNLVVFQVKIAPSITSMRNDIQKITETFFRRAVPLSIRHLPISRQTSPAAAQV